MVKLRSRRAMIVAFAIAVVIVLLFGSGIGSTEVLLLPFLFILPLVVLYAVIKLAFGAAIRDTRTGGDDIFDGTAREIWTGATRGARSATTSTDYRSGTCKRDSRRPDAAPGGPARAA